MFKNKIAFITGASSGFGEACARLFAEHGAKLILCARRNDRLEKLAKELYSDFKTETHIVKLDVRVRADVKSCIDSLPAEWKTIDVLINSAGLASGLGKVHEGDIDDWEAMIDTNVKGLLYLTRSVVPLMINNGGNGHVINIGSIAGIAAYPNGGVYCGSKAAVRLISDGLRIDLVDTNIRVTNIQPGLAETEFSMVRFHGDEEKAAQVYKGIEALTGLDIAEIALFSANRPTHVQICEITVTPTFQASAQVVFKKEDGK
ncbi:MAG: SDR family oxidoreductase [Bacteroidetes bacterium]|jgi:3-hydroxy acid dehydrogenase / malonic semialdehyde reductase|nr:SDR family oxidoreductase [Bacteroidota bacterium]MBT5529479.1 SDR family oxidoreductase [Cytophagia bacterium]MBT3421234.1 SDR family oxidoreductase [Bacteroidota bacterium]MBT3801653.1 SDR family oxidoreductase [Bacteroidota bacterium]MBT3935220.1 SDR family oxidoreductase [Bacteroidota bacterium]